MTESVAPPGPANAPVNPIETLDFSSPDTFINGHPYDEYRRLREQAPVFWNPEPAGRGFWGLTRYADITSVSSNPEVFCNGQGYKSVDDTYRRVDDHVGKAMSRILPAVDPPEHTELRKLYSQFFTAAAMRKMEEDIRARARRIIDSLDGRTDIDIVADVAIPLPVQVLGNLLGVPEEDHHLLLKWTDAIFGADDADYFIKPADAAASFFEMFEYGQTAIDARRKNPTNDLLSAVANAKMGDQLLDREQVDGTLAMFVGAGNETSRNAISGSLLELWRHPEVRAELVQNPELIRTATDELLRVITPAIHMRRTATRDAEIGGQPIAMGEKVVMFYGAANRDPAVFPEPDRLDIHRPNARQNLAFGFGVHRCIGAPVAQIELRIFLEEFLPRYPEYEITGDPRYLRHNFVHAIKSMPATIA